MQDTAVNAPPVTFRELAPAAIELGPPFKLVLPSGMVLRIPATFEPAALGTW